MRLTYPTSLVLQALLQGHHHGFDIMDAVGLPSGTVYPILRRLDAEGLVKSRWEKEGVARREQRPPRRYYELTSAGRIVAQRSRVPLSRHSGRLAGDASVRLGALNHGHSGPICHRPHADSPLRMAGARRGAPGLAQRVGR